MMFIFLITFDTLTVKHVIIEQQQSNWQTLMAFGIMRVASPPLSRPDSPVRLDYKCLGGRLRDTDSAVMNCFLQLQSKETAKSCSSEDELKGQTGIIFVFRRACRCSRFIFRDYV